MLEHIDFEEAAGKTIKTVTRAYDYAVIVVFTDGTCCSLEAGDDNGSDADLSLDNVVSPPRYHREVLDKAFGVEAAGQFILEAAVAQEAELAEYRRTLAEQEAAEVAAMQKAAGVVPIAVVTKLLDVLKAVVASDMPGPDLGRILTDECYNAACAAIGVAMAQIEIAAEHA